ncbi:MAG: alternative ribosome rescue aminoacyl-tRNA hydrolase ArfB [Bacteroidota bacterium]
MNQHKKRITASDLRKEIEVTTARSSGPGGQNVNKLDTKVILRFDLINSKVLSDLEKKIVSAAIPSKITKKGEIIVSSDSKRTQLKNKEIAFKKLDRLLAKSFQKKKQRITTTPSKASIKRRLDSKKKQSEKKEFRKKIV